MKQFLFFIAITILSNEIIFAQEDYQYLGVIKLNDSSMISYKISFMENNGIVRGYSVTDLSGEHETKSSIIGTFDEDENNFEFKETDIVYTKSPILQKDFCFINFEGELKKINEKYQIKGRFKGLYNDGSECISGEIRVASLSRILKQAKKLDKKIDRNPFVKKEDKARIDVERTIDSLNINVIDKNENLNIFTDDQRITLIIYDMGKEDGDKINLDIAGERILTSYEITKDRKQLIVDLENPATIIKLKALNEGAIAPNTVRLQIVDSNNQIKTLTNLKAGEEASITILKREE
ncbi:MAG: hypothetical protein WBG90_12300 [Saonia sp.]